MIVRKIALNTIVSFGSRILGIVLALLTVGLITRYLSREEWGQYSVVLSFGAIFTILAEWGLYQLAVREISRPGADERKILGNIFTLRLTGGLAIFALAPLAALLLPYSGETRWGILVGMLGYWFFSGAQVLMGLFQKRLRMDKVATGELAGRLVQLFLIWLIVRYNLGFLPAVWALAAGALANFLIIFVFAQRYVRFRLSFDLAFWRQCLQMSFPLAVSGVLVMAYFSSGSFFLSIFRPVEEVGIYQLPHRILESLIVFPSMFVGLIMPLLSAAAGADEQNFKKILQRSGDVLMIIVWPMVAGVFALSPAIINLLGGNKYPESVPVLNILMLAVAAIFFGTLFSYSLIARHLQKKLLWISAAGAAVNLPLSIIFIPRYSYFAAALITALTEIFVTALMAALLYRAIQSSFSLKTGAKSLLAAFLMLVVLHYFPNQNWFLLLWLGAFIYSGIFYLLGGISAKEIRYVIGLTQKS